VRTAGKPSIRIEAHTVADVNVYREVDHKGMIAVKPGDHIVMKYWVKTGPSTLGKNGVYGNGALGFFDYYGDDGTYHGRLGEHSSDNPRCDTDPTWSTYLNDPRRYVPMGGDWQQRTLDTIVPAHVLDVTKGTVTGVVTGILPVLSGPTYTNNIGGVMTQDQGTVWFADGELYINPNSTSTAPPVPPEQQHYTLTVNVVGNGTVTINPQSATYLSGTTVTLTAVPENENFTLSAWSGDIGCSKNPINVTMDGNKTVTAIFVPAVYGIPGDLNHDGKVDLKDLALFASMWGLRRGDAGFIPEADLNGDGVINLVDFVTFASMYQKSSS
jgi:hypothetical protein